jgi:hypothetical protein
MLLVRAGDRFLGLLARSKADLEGQQRVNSFAEPSANGRNLRIGAVHHVVFARQQSPSGHRRQHGF